MSLLTDTRTAWVSDIAPGPRKVLAHRFPDAPNLGDITTVDWTQVEPVDVITGGSPCQEMSTAGKWAGMRSGTRSGLWGSMVDAVMGLRPPLVAWENVLGARSAAAETRRDEMGRDEMGRDEMERDEMGRDEMERDEMGRDEMSGPMFGRSLFMELRMSDLGGFCVERRGVPAVDVATVRVTVGAQHYRSEPRHVVTVLLQGMSRSTGQHVDVPVTRRHCRDVPDGYVRLDDLPRQVQAAVEHALAAVHDILSR